MKQYEGREDLLLEMLKELVIDKQPVLTNVTNEKPFDEPPEEKEVGPPVFNIVDTILAGTGLIPSSQTGRTKSPPNSPSKISRARTSQTHLTGQTQSTGLTDKTQKVDNTRKGLGGLGSISETAPIAENSSISSAGAAPGYLPDGLMTNSMGGSPNRDTARTRELRVEEYSSNRWGLKSENYNATTIAPTSRIAKRAMKVSTPASVASMPDDESGYMDEEDTDAFDDTVGTDEVSALSVSDIEFLERKERFDNARRQVLDEAIRKKDWDTAASLTETIRDEMRQQKLVDSYDVSADSEFHEWTQSELDKFIAQNDWDAVARYIAIMRDSKKSPVNNPPSNTTAIRQRSSASNTSSNSSGLEGYRKRFGARSQLQHTELNSVSSWESESSYVDSEYTSASEDAGALKSKESARRKEFAC
jgi:hypothetical protein